MKETGFGSTGDDILQGKIDYEKLIRDFGSTKISDELLERMRKLTVGSGSPPDGRKQIGGSCFTSSYSTERASGTGFGEVIWDVACWSGKLGESSLFILVLAFLACLIFFVLFVYGNAFSSTTAAVLGVETFMGGTHSNLIFSFVGIDSRHAKRCWVEVVMQTSWLERSYGLHVLVNGACTTSISVYHNISV